MGARKVSGSEEARYRISWPRIVLWVVFLGVAVYAANELIFESDEPVPTHMEPE